MIIEPQKGSHGLFRGTKQLRDKIHKVKVFLLIIEGYNSTTREACTLNFIEKTSSILFSYNQSCIAQFFFL